MTDVEKLKISSKIRSLDVEKVLIFFSEVTKVCLSFRVQCIRTCDLLFSVNHDFVFFFFFFLQEGLSHGANLLTAVEVLASGVTFDFYMPSSFSHTQL